MPLQLPPTLETPRLCLRKPAVSDAQDIYDGYAQDSLVCRYMIWQPHTSPDTTRAFLADCVQAWEAGSDRRYVITLAGSDRAIGMIDARPQGTTVETGYVLAPAHWGRGLMPEAIQALTAAALACPGIYRVHAAVDAENLASQRALEKAGFVREARLERYGVHPNVSAEPRACLMYAIWR